MIEIGLEEFVASLIAKKVPDGAVDEVQLARTKRELLAIADRAVDVAIMRAVMRSAHERLIPKAAVDKVYDLMQSRSKAEMDKYLRKILDLDQEIADELGRMEEMYLRGFTHSR